MEFNQIQEIRKKTTDQRYKDYVSDNGWKYQTEEQLLAGYMRQSKSKQGTPLTLLNSEWGFEASRIKLLGTPYYEATDWNFICFRCGPYDWLMRDGDLYQLYQ